MSARRGLRTRMRPLHRAATNCDRNGCPNVAVRLLEWDAYNGTTKACDKHARWWKLRSTTVVNVTPLEGATR